jgi:hypothetical protein
MMIKTVVYHTYNQMLFDGQACLRDFLEDSWITLPPKGRKPALTGELLRIVREAQAKVIVAQFACPVLGYDKDIDVRSLVPIAHPITRLLAFYRRRTNQKTEASFAEFVRDGLGHSRNSEIANGQVAFIAGCMWQWDFSKPGEAERIIHLLLEHTDIGLTDFPELMRCLVARALFTVGAPMRSRIVVTPVVHSNLISAIEEASSSLPRPLWDQLVARNSADLHLFDAISSKMAEFAPITETERKRIQNIAGTAAELTGHRRKQSIVVVGDTIEELAAQHSFSFYQPEPVLGWWPKPNAKTVMDVLGRRVAIEVDDQGYRPVPCQPAVANRTLAVYGCSFTFGHALPVEETFCARLQGMLPDWRIENHGMNAFGTAHHLVQLERATLWQPADFVTFCWIPGHMHRAIAHHSVVQGYQSPVWLASPVSIWPKAFITNDGALSLKHVSLKRPELAGINLDDFGPDYYHIEYVAARMFQRAAEMVRESGGHFFVTIMRHSMSDNLRSQLEAAKIPIVDAALNDRKYSLMPFDGHPNAKANEIFAERIFTYLARRGDIDMSADRSVFQEQLS